MDKYADRLANKCLHFTGLMSQTCAAGISYADVRFDRPYKVPCLNQGGECALRQFPTAEQIKEKEDSIFIGLAPALKAFDNAKNHYKIHGKETGTTMCGCGKETLSYAVASNGHFRIRCTSCGVAAME